MTDTTMPDSGDRISLVDQLEAAETRLNETYLALDRIHENPDGPEGDLSDGQVSEAETLQTDYEAQERRVAALKTRISIEARRRAAETRQVSPDDVPTDGGAAPMAAAAAAAPALELGRTRAVMNSPTWGFATVGHWAQAVAMASGKSSAGWHENLRVVRGEQREGFGTEGGFLVPTEMSESITRVVLGDLNQSLAARCRQMQISGNTIKIPLNMSVPYDSTGAIRAYWGRESGRHTLSQTAFDENLIELQKITSMVNVTDELLEDAMAIGTYISDAAPMAITYEVNDAILNGDGVGKPLGIMHSGNKALITVAKETNQAADTIVKNNLLKMYSNLPPESQMNAVVLVSPTSQVPVWDLLFTNRGEPGRGYADAMYSTIFTKPVMPHISMQDLGDKGDILFVDFGKYDFITRGSGVRSATSMHMHFDQDIMSLKFQMRCNGQPAWNKQISVPHGSHKLSPYVTLAARA